MVGVASTTNSTSNGRRYVPNTRRSNTVTSHAGPTRGGVSHAELARTGEVGLMEALPRVTAIANKQLRFGQTVCVFVDGRPASGVPLRLWDIEAIEAVEVYTGDSKSEFTGTLARASRGYDCQATEITDTSPTVRDRIRWLVIWAKR